MSLAQPQPQPEPSPPLPALRLVPQDEEAADAWDELDEEEKQELRVWTKN